MTDPMSMQFVAAAIAEATKAAAGEAGKQVWAGLSGLVRRIFGHESPQSAAVAAVEADPADQMQRGFLAGSLAAQAQTDQTFAQDLRAWIESVAAVAAPRTGAGNVWNTIKDANISGGVVIQARDIEGGATFHTGRT